MMRSKCSELIYFTIWLIGLTISLLAQPQNSKLNFVLKQNTMFYKKAVLINSLAVFVLMIAVVHIGRINKKIVRKIKLMRKKMYIFDVIYVSWQ
jgi:uncharacterized membrane protein